MRAVHDLWRCAQRKSEEDSSDAPKRCKLTTLPAADVAAGDHSNDLTTTNESLVGESTQQNGEHGKD